MIQKHRTRRVELSVLRIFLLICNLFFSAPLFYKIKFNSNDEYEILFDKIQSGLTMAVSLISFSYYVCKYGVIEFSLNKLREIDDSMRSVGIKHKPPSADSSFLSFEVVVRLMVALIYFLCKYLRYLYLNSDEILGNLRHSFAQTYCIMLNEFVMVSFVRTIEKGKRRFKTLNRYINEKVRNYAALIKVEEMAA